MYLEGTNLKRPCSRLLRQARSTKFGENMRFTKPVPLVTDLDFEIRTPGFIVLYGYVVHRMAIQEKIMNVGDTVSYNRHGSFRVCCIHEGHAVIRHTKLSGKVMILLVPNEHWLRVSNGSYKTFHPHYETFLECYKWLDKKPATLSDVGQPWIHHPPELTEKYHNLFLAFQGYWKEKFHESLQEDQDSGSYALGARIRYGMTCAMRGQPIPIDCDYAKLVTEVDNWIEYQENPFL